MFTKTLDGTWPNSACMGAAADAQVHGSLGGMQSGATGEAVWIGLLLCVGDAQKETGLTQ